MSMIVPVHIKPHLVNFLFDYFPTHKEAKYRGKKVKSVQIKPRSPMERYIRAMCVKSDFPVKNTSFNFFFSIDEQCSKGSVYAYQSGRYNLLFFPEEFVKDLNNMFEEIFSLSFFYFVEGYRSNNTFGARREAIRAFCDKYDLLEYGFSVYMLEKRYSRICKHPWKTLIKNTTNPYDYSKTQNQ